MQGFESRMVWIHAVQTAGVVETEMAYGAIVRYYYGGIEFHEMLGEEDYTDIEEEDVD